MPTKQSNDVLPSIKTKKRKTSGKKIVIIVISIALLAIIGIVVSKPIKSKFTSYKNKIEQLKELDKITKERDALQTKLQEETENNKALSIKIQALDKYEKQFTQFEEQKKAFDENVATLDKEFFLEQYEKMNPETAKEIYQEFVQKKVTTNEQKEFAKTIGEMEPEQAALALEKVIPTDPELIKMIFNNMDNESKALILSAMKSDSAANVIRLISPDIKQ